jgi:hypothetical protein
MCQCGVDVMVCLDGATQTHGTDSTVVSLLNSQPTRGLDLTSMCVVHTYGGKLPTVVTAPDHAAW